MNEWMNHQVLPKPIESVQWIVVPQWIVLFSTLWTNGSWWIYALSNLWATYGSGELQFVAFFFFRILLYRSCINAKKCWCWWIHWMGNLQWEYVWNKVICLSCKNRKLKSFILSCFSLFIWFSQCRWCILIPYWYLGISSFEISLAFLWVNCGKTRERGLY